MKPLFLSLDIALAVALLIPLSTSAHYVFRLNTWSYFLALEDLGPGSNGTSADPLTGANFARWLGAGDNILMLRIADYGEKDFEIDVLDAAPPDEDLSGWDHVAEADVRFQTGHIFSSTGEEPPSDQELFSLPPGGYRARVYAGGTASVYEWDADGLPNLMAVGGNDHYRVLLWPHDSDAPDTRVLKWRYCPAGQAPAFQPVFASLVQALVDRAGTPLDCGLIGPGGDVFQESSRGYLVNQVSAGVPVLWPRPLRAFDGSSAATV